MKVGVRLAVASVFLIALLGGSTTATAAPPAPTLVEPAQGGALAQPMTLRWSAVSDPNGPIVSYTWQVATTSGFSSVILSGFTDTRDGDPVPTQGRVSGLPNGTYFWRVKATQNVGGTVGSVDTAWSAVRSFSITGLGPAPAGTPSFSGPGNGSQFHTYEFFKITWTAVPGAQYYVLEAANEPTFSYPLTLSLNPMEFGTSFRAGWGNEIPNIYYRVRAVSVDNVRGLPSPTLNVHIVNTAPVPPPPTQQFPVNGATVSLPFTFTWSPTANPQIPGYDVDVDTDPTFSGPFGVLLLQNLSRSDYMLAKDPSTSTDLAPGSYFWRVRAQHGSVFGPWSAGTSFHVVASPPTPPGLKLFWLLAQPSSVSGGFSTQARVSLNTPAPAGGAVVTIASDLPHAEVPSRTVTIPAGATDAVVSPVTTIPVNGSVVGDLRAAYGGTTQQSSLGLSPLLFSLAVNNSAVNGGNSLTGTVTLLRAAPVGGIEVTLVSGDTSLVQTPAKVVVPEGATAASFAITTAAVTSSRSIRINTGTANDNFRAPEVSLTLLPAGSAAPAASLAGVAVQTPSVLGGHTTTGTVTLTAPAPAGGASVAVNGSMEGQVVTPSGGVTVPAGSTSANFTITAPQVSQSYWVMIQASYGNQAGLDGAVVRIDPAQPAIPDLSVLAIDPVSGTAGASFSGTVGLATPAPPGGTSVSLSSSDPTTAQVPASVFIAAGNSVNSFTITTSSAASSTAVQISAQSGSVTKTFWITVFANPNAPPAGALSAVGLSPTSVTGGSAAQGTVTTTAAAPAGGLVVTLSSNTAAATVPPSVTVPAGATSATFTVSTTSVAASTTATITATAGSVTRTTTLTVNPPPPPTAAALSALSLSPTSVTGGSAAQGTVTLTAAAPAGGLVVTLSSNNAAATVPPSVTVPAGATSATFTVSTSSVAASTTATITATAGSVTRTATLTVNPASQTVTLSVTATGRSGETVTSSPAGINLAVGSTASAPFATGTKITLSVSNGRTAIWSGACSSGGQDTPSCTFTIAATASVTANVQ
jgi:hypothetical protein